MSSLCAREIVKSYTDSRTATPILLNVSLTVERGESVAIVGASGSGKSTLLHILGGLDRPSQGVVEYDGQSLYDQDDAALAAFRNTRVGFVFQFYHLLPEFTALENVMLPCLLGGVSHRDAATRARTWLERVGLSHRLSHRPHALSGGEQQRVAIARALVRQPALLLADEPTGNLDQSMGEGVMALLREQVRENNMTMILVTHNRELITATDRRFDLSEGSLHG